MTCLYSKKFRMSNEYKFIYFHSLNKRIEYRTEAFASSILVKDFFRPPSSFYRKKSATIPCIYIGIVLSSLRLHITFLDMSIFVV